MTPIQELQNRIRLYLLGQLSDGAGEEMERELLSNEEAFTELLIVEDELTDEYVNGGLSPDERAGFEKHFLAAPERQENLRFARAFDRFVSTARSNEEKVAAAGTPASWHSQTFLFRATAAVAVVAILLGAWWILRSRTPAGQNFATISLTLSAGERSEGTQAATVKLLPDADGLKAVLKLPDRSVPAARYRVEVEHESGARNTVEVTAQDAHSLTVVIPASILKRGQNSLKLFATSADGNEQRVPGSYLFTVE
jgi:anti-sigma factor RsiW